MIIKATRLQAWAPAGGGGGRAGRPPLEKKFFGYIGGISATFSSYGAFLVTFFSFLGTFSPCGGLFATFYFMVGAFFGACHPPYENFCGLP